MTRITDSLDKNAFRFEQKPKLEPENLKRNFTFGDLVSTTDTWNNLSKRDTSNCSNNSYTISEMSDDTNPCYRLIEAGEERYNEA